MQKFVTLVGPITVEDSPAMGQLFQPFLFFVVRYTENELRRQIEFLEAEKEILRKRAAKERIFDANRAHDGRIYA